MKIPYKLNEQEYGFVEVNLGDTVQLRKTPNASGYTIESDGEHTGIVVQFDMSYGELPKMVKLWVNQSDGKQLVLDAVPHYLANARYKLYRDSKGEPAEPVVEAAGGRLGSMLATDEGVQ